MADAGNTPMDSANNEGNSATKNLEQLAASINDLIRLVDRKPTFLERLTALSGPIALVVTPIWILFVHCTQTQPTGAIERRRAEAEIRKLDDEQLAAPLALDVSIRREVLSDAKGTSVPVINAVVVAKNIGSNVARVERTKLELFVAPPPEKVATIEVFAMQSITWGAPVASATFALEGDGTSGGGATAVLHPGEDSRYERVLTVAPEIGSWLLLRVTAQINGRTRESSRTVQVTASGLFEMEDKAALEREQDSGL